MSRTSYKKSAIVEMQPVRRADGGITYIPQRDAAPLAEMDAAPLAAHAARVPRATVETRGGYTDKAKAFSLKTWQLSALAGVGLYLLGKVAAGYPWLSVGAILTLLGGMAAVWFLSFALDLIFSPEGAELLDIASFWAYMRAEQKERHRHYQESRKNDRLR